MHPTLNSKVHHDLFQTACTVCTRNESPKRTRKTMPAGNDGTYPYPDLKPSMYAWQPILSCCWKACSGVRAWSDIWAGMEY